ncbi:response regulator [Maribacter sp. Hel_I_7]|uniref:response regulator n=1 Tax=Maribacter sp. Hel_I_7 TaxID=1249997 RepID=UPI0009DDFB6F|nr:response regulator [Maribacter sp. Hel_I_7]
MKANETFCIYMAEDDMDDQQIFKGAISSIDKDLELTIFSDGVALLEALNNKKHKPNVIFLDLYMPKMNGEETLLKIRQNSILDRIPVVIFSNEYNIDHISDLFEYGANRYLHKPNSFQTLTTALNRTIESIKNNTLGGTAIIKYAE